MPYQQRDITDIVKNLQNTQRDNRMPAPAKARTTYCQRFL